MALTFGDVRKEVAEYAGRGGKCVDSPETARFARKVLEHLLISGQYGSIRKFCFVAEKGLFTAPPEFEIALKVRIDGRVGEVWSKWFSYHSVSCELDGCEPAEKILADEPNPVCTAYPLPKGGSILGVLGTCEEENAFLIVQGKDPTGREIITMFDGEQIVGERFRIKKGELRFGKVMFGEITGILKSKTNGYTQLFAVDPVNRQQKFLGDYSPLEEIPRYKQLRIMSNRCAPLHHVSVLARIRLKDHYTDNDIVPFESTLPLTIAAQRLFAESNNDLNVVNAKKASLKEFIEGEAAYKKGGGTFKVDVFVPLSGGAIKNIQ